MCENQLGERITIGGPSALADMSGGSDLSVKEELALLDSSACDPPIMRVGWPDDFQTKADDSERWLLLDPTTL
jgi:hypothetical protein